MSTSRGRQVFANQTILDQADFFQNDGFSRVVGLTTSDIVCQIFFNNQLQSWPLSDGTSVTDAQVASGSVYFFESPASTGFYSVRFRPNAIGFWRIILTYTTGMQITAQDYDVISPSNDTGGVGIRSSFSKP